MSLDPTPSADSTAVQSRPEGRFDPPASGRQLAVRTATGVLVAVLLVLAVRVAVGAAGVDLGGAGPRDPFAPGPQLATTVVAGVGAAVVYAALDRLTAAPARYFLGVAAAVFVVMLGPVVLVAPSFGVTAAGQLVLVTVHAAVAVPLVVAVLGLVGR